MSSAPTVRTCAPEQRPQLVEVLARAFATDPVVTWLLGPARSDPAHRRRFFRALVSRRFLAAGTADLVEGGAAVWYRPGEFEATGAPLAALRTLPAVAWAFGPRLRTAAVAEQAMRAHHPEEPHWYLQLVGVEPSRTGQGIGSALLAHRLAEIDAAGGAAYLESSSPRNVPLYERHGFVVREEVRLAPGAPPEWLMWRPAAGQATIST